jgi:hypothetical protein
MACTPFPALTVGGFDQSAQGVWANFNETKGDRSCAYVSGNLTVTGPNGSVNFSPPLGGFVKHKFFGTGNYLAVLTTDGAPGPGTRTVEIVDFVASTISSTQVIFVTADSTNPLPWLEPSPGVGSACLVGAPTPSGVAGLVIYRSDTGAVLCAGPSPYTPTGFVSGEVVAGGSVRIKDGTTIIAGPCPSPAGNLTVAPASQAFPTVKVGGCPQAPSTRQFTLRNSGTDCLTITAIGAAGPFSVTSQSTPFPATLNPGAQMTVTVTFAPIAVGTYSVNLAIARNPAVGASQIGCTGVAQAAVAAFSAPGLVDFGTVRVGTPVTRTVTITNSGDVPINLAVAGSSAGAFQWAGFNGPLDCGKSAPITVTFIPTATGQVSTMLTATGTPGGTHIVTLQGTGCIPQATIAVPPAPFPSFGNVRQGYREPRYITVHNTGNDTLSFNATISGPDAALFGLMRPSQSITDVVPPGMPRSYSVEPTFHCGGGAIGDGAEEVVVVFFANAAPPATANATLTIDGHNDPSAPASFTFALTASVIAGNVVDVAAVFDTSGSMADLAQGGVRKIDAAIAAGRLLVGLLPPDLTNRIVGARFATDATVFLPLDAVTGANQGAKVAAVADPPLTPIGSTAIAAGVMTGIAVITARPAPLPPLLTKAAIVLTDGMDNTAFKNPADNLYYSILGHPAYDPAHLGTLIPTHAFVPPSDTKVFAIGLGVGQDIDLSQLATLASGAGGHYLVVDPTQPGTTYQLEKLYTQIYMDLIDIAVIKDPRFTIDAGNKDVHEFDVLDGDVSATIVIYDIDGFRLPFWLETPAGEIVDASFVPAGFQLRAGYTETTRFLEFVMPWGDPARYAGRWRLVVANDGRLCRGAPALRSKNLGFMPGDCKQEKRPIDYGFAIGVGSNFRLDAYLTPAPVKVGDPIRLTAVPSEAGLPVTGCTITVDAVAPNGQSWNGLRLFDDGAHQDADPDDGEYARVFTTTAVAGSYTFTFHATGFTRDGKTVARETVRAKYVEGTVRPPDGNGGPGSDDCCRKLEKLLERQTRLLSQYRSAESIR